MELNQTEPVAQDWSHNLFAEQQLNEEVDPSNILVESNSLFSLCAAGTRSVETQNAFSRMSCAHECSCDACFATDTCLLQSYQTTAKCIPLVCDICHRNLKSPTTPYWFLKAKFFSSFKCVCGLYQVKALHCTKNSKCRNRPNVNSASHLYTFPLVCCTPPSLITSLKPTSVLWSLGVLRDWHLPVRWIHILILLTLLSYLYLPVHALQQQRLHSFNKCHNGKVKYDDLFCDVTMKRTARGDMPCSDSHKHSTKHIDCLRRHLCCQLAKTASGFQNANGIKTHTLTDLPYGFSSTSLSGATQLTELEINCASNSNLHYLSSSLFCNHYSLDHLLSDKYQGLSQYKLYSNCTTIGCSQSMCLDDLHYIFEADQNASKAYNTFAEIMQKYPTPNSYSIIEWEHEQCLVAYKQWICSHYHTVYWNDLDNVRQAARPCSSYCLRVEALCPFFRIHNQTKLRGGQSTFICQGHDVEHAEPQTTTNCHSCRAINTTQEASHSRAPANAATHRKTRHNNTKLLPSQRTLCANCSVTSVANPRDRGWLVVGKGTFAFASYALLFITQYFLAALILV